MNHSTCSSYVPFRCAGRSQIVGEPREEFIEYLKTTGEKSVRMRSLRYAAPLYRRGRKLIGFQQKHFAKMVGQNTGREQACHTSTDDDRAFTSICWR